MVLVDSSVWIGANRREGDLLAKVALETLLEEDEAAFCGPVRLEVLGAMRRESRARFDAYFEIVPYLTMVETTWNDSVEIARKLRDGASLTLPWNDVLITAIARRHQVRVYSIDGHFAELERHGHIRLYRPGPGGSFVPDGD